MPSGALHAILIMILGLLLSASSLLGCSGDGSNSSPTTGEDTDGDTETADDSDEEASFPDGDGVSDDDDDDTVSDGDLDGDETDGDTENGDAEESGEEEPPIPNSANYLILTDDALAESAATYAAFRQNHGSWTEVRTASSLQQGNDGTAFLANVQAWVRSARESLDERLPLFVLILGDAPGERESIQGRVPALSCTNMEGDCYTDNKYVDLDNDGLPDAALGRLPIRHDSELTDYLENAIQHEEQTPPGVWNRRVTLYTGEADFSPEIDALLEFLVFYALTKVSYDFDILGVYNSPASDYYYTPYEDKVLDLLNAGNLLGIYIGHGSSGSTDGLSLDNLDRFSSDHRFPFAFFFACLNGAYRESGDSLAEAVLRLPRGAIASVASSDISHPYGNAVLSYEAQRASLNLRLPTIGEVVQEMKRAALTNTDDALRELIDSSAAMELDPELYEPLLLEHLNLYNLFGDPALTMHYPDGTVSFDAANLPSRLEPGTLNVSGSVDLFYTGTVLVTLECSRSAIINELEEVTDAASIRRNWEKAMDKVVASVEVPLVDGHFQASLAVSEALPMVTYYVKALAVGEGLDAVGNVKITGK